MLVTVKYISPFPITIMCEVLIEDVQVRLLQNKKIKL